MLALMILGVVENNVTICQNNIFDQNFYCFIHMLFAQIWELICTNIKLVSAPKTI